MESETNSCYVSNTTVRSAKWRQLKGRDLQQEAGCWRLARVRDTSGSNIHSEAAHETEDGWAEPLAGWAQPAGAALHLGRLSKATHTDGRHSDSQGRQCRRPSCKHDEENWNALTSSSNGIYFKVTVRLKVCHSEFNTVQLSYGALG